MIEVRIDSSRTTMDLRRLGQGVERVTSLHVRRTGLDLQGKVRARASGRPGPRVQTGYYRRSITVGPLERRSYGVYQVEVYTMAPYGRRLEHGFMNRRDRLGRLFRQPARPHWGPAIEIVDAAHVRDLEAALTALIAAGGSTP